MWPDASACLGRHRAQTGKRVVLIWQAVLLLEPWLPRPLVARAERDRHQLRNFLPLWTGRHRQLRLSLFLPCCHRAYGSMRTTRGEPPVGCLLSSAGMLSERAASGAAVRSRPAYTHSLAHARTPPLRAITTPHGLRTADQRTVSHVRSRERSYKGVDIGPGVLQSR